MEIASFTMFPLCTLSVIVESKGKKRLQIQLQSFQDDEAKRYRQHIESHLLQLLLDIITLGVNSMEIAIVDHVSASIVSAIVESKG
jgi:hypothetical protein